MLGPSSSGQEQGWLPGTMGKRVLGMGMGAVPLGGLGRVHVEILCQHCWMGWLLCLRGTFPLWLGMGWVVVLRLPRSALPLMLPHLAGQSWDAFGRKTADAAKNKLAVYCHADKCLHGSRLKIPFWFYLCPKTLEQKFSEGKG